MQRPLPQRLARAHAHHGAAARRCANYTPLLPSPLLSPPSAPIRAFVLSHGRSQAEPPRERRRARARCADSHLQPLRRHPAFCAQDTQPPLRPRRRRAPPPRAGVAGHGERLPPQEPEGAGRLAGLPVRRPKVREVGGTFPGNTSLCRPRGVSCWRLSMCLMPSTTCLRSGRNSTPSAPPPPFRATHSHTCLHLRARARATATEPRRPSRAYRAATCSVCVCVCACVCVCYKVASTGGSTPVNPRLQSKFPPGVSPLFPTSTHPLA